jgi:uncharacterized membrane protein YwzB
MQAFLDWCRLFCSGDVVRRALKYAVVVGAVLVAINYGDVLMRGEVTRADVLKMMLTILVPYCVSALSSVGTIQQLQQREH